ncbi:hypothetical protein AWRI1631_22290 [Saccharomyces cerevisiae AWRI1631]|uniref:Uncharacterized protein n=1 Tax=Saccharomyces cerevisiae (strain AWRI1631) TaxID=545124 RepID=B5VEA4_YEAS6|nr:hypothetical protein AWRI1631_22290 [Saccharomyces cerevisiae AWRI1631]
MPGPILDLVISSFSFSSVDMYSFVLLFVLFFFNLFISIIRSLFFLLMDSRLFFKELISCLCRRFSCFNVDKFKFSNFNFSNLSCFSCACILPFEMWLVILSITWSLNWSSSSSQDTFCFPPEVKSISMFIVANFLFR